MENIPWNDAAIAICRPAWGHPRERVIVARGTLAEVVEEIAATLSDLPASLSISLPDRNAAPLGYDAVQIATLLAERHAGRTLVAPVD